MTELRSWTAEFVARVAQRALRPEPEWSGGCHLHPDVARSLQKFQVGESSDGAHLIANAAAGGDRDYEAAVRLFVLEEQNHARMLALLLGAAGVSTKRGHWSDFVFVWMRRSLDLRLELMVLAVAEVVALRYYRALSEGGDDLLLMEVAERILDDERHHAPFQCRRLRAAFEQTSVPARAAIKFVWCAVAFAVIIVVAIDHGRALAVCGVRRRRFIVDTMRLFTSAAATVFVSTAAASAPT